MTGIEPHDEASYSSATLCVFWISISSGRWCASMVLLPETTGMPRSRARLTMLYAASAWSITSTIRLMSLLSSISSTDVVKRDLSTSILRGFSGSRTQIFTISAWAFFDFCTTW